MCVAKGCSFCAKVVVDWLRLPDLLLRIAHFPEVMQGAFLGNRHSVITPLGFPAGFFLPLIPRKIYINQLDDLTLGAPGLDVAAVFASIGMSPRPASVAFLQHLELPMLLAPPLALPRCALRPGYKG